jgi:type I restriction enzyme S subunit
VITNALPKRWARSPLGEIGEWRGGGTPSKSVPEFWQNGTVPWVSPKDMKSDVIHDSVDHISAAAVKKSATQLISAQSVLIVTRSGILQHTLPVAINAVPVTLNQDLKAITPFVGIEAHYIAWALRAENDAILHECSKTGTTVQSIETPALQRFMIPVAPLSEQRRIVAAIEEHLSDVDAAVLALERVRANLKRYRASVLMTAFTLEKTPIRTGHELFSVVTSGSRGWAQYYSDDGALFLRVGNLDRQTVTLDLNDVQRVTPPQGSEGLRTRLEQNDILVSITADIGMVALVPQLGEPAYINQHVALARPEVGVYAAYVAWYLASEYGQKQFDELRRGATKAGLGLDDIRGVRVPIPPLAEQHRIVAEVERRLTTVERTEADVDAQLRRAARLRQSILKRAFEGKLVPQDPNDEPASVLLDRIRAERAAAPAVRRTRATRTAR